MSFELGGVKAMPETLQHTTTDCGCDDARAHSALQQSEAVNRPRGWRWVVSLPSVAVVSFLVLIVRGYQTVISPALAPRCRFHPSCSAYAIGALRRHGLIRGSLRATWRLLRCNPFGRGGYDPP